ncbi:Heat shock protein GrpE [Candidatus Rhodobacter oscarellae]|uniref:Protein GrpE n=1 Tax=Candidatus Rhodobacter oscarellae TaxID=1675527 RepID=A0A0J9E831_9RHOB|nr:nucleotide exchange factor GrpE [Candidatus Rhodobacter lobularis]KMW58891.1 Heat shock protein GrpE [Candidatus Rhodobacter lobularis]
MSDEQKKPSMPDVDLSALDDGETIDITQEIEEAAETAAIDATIEALVSERDDLRDKFMRALADAENSRKRSERDRREAEQYGGSKLARDMLPVYDNLSRAIDAANDEQKAAAGAIMEGVELTLRELLNVFKKHGIEPIHPEVGERFDPQQHQAMFEAPLPETKAGDIIQVSQTGFMLHDRLLRPAQVGVSSTPG